MSSLERLASPKPRESPVPAAPLRERRYGEDRLHLLVRDPKTALVIWEISPGLAERASAMARAAQDPVRYQIRIEQVTGAEARPEPARAIDLPDALRDELWYVELPQSGGRVRAHLGLDLRAGFLPLLTSRWASVPPGRACAETGTWDIEPEAAAWLERRLGEAGVETLGIAPSSAARYLVPPGLPRP